MTCGLQEQSLGAMLMQFHVVQSHALILLVAQKKPYSITPLRVMSPGMHFYLMTWLGTLPGLPF